jgi:hypothetical protein
MLKKIKQLRCYCMIFLTHHIALPVLKKIRNEEIFPYTMDQLTKMDTGTVGKDLANFLGSKKLPLLPHYARHDMKHVLLGFDTTEEGELCLQSFMLGNGRISLPVIATVLFGVLTSPEYWRKMHTAFRAGRNANCIHRWNWFTLVTQKTEDIRRNIFHFKIKNHELV